MEYALQNFQGPLDLLLHLIQKAKIEPEEIFVSQITEQYLSYTRQIQPADMEMASDFLKMAATLIYIKSRALLPAKRREQEDLDEEGRTPEEQLVLRLKEYRKYKAAAQVLQRMEEQHQGSVFKLPEELFASGETVDLEEDIAMLQLAFQKILQKVKQEKQAAVPRQEIIARETYHVRSQKKIILARLSIASTLSFEDLFSSPYASKDEVVTTFLALLELLQESKILVQQTTHFGMMEIRRKRKEA